MAIHRAHLKKKWISIVGARPHFVKLAPLCRAIEEHNRQFPGREIDHQIIQTGQHYDRDVAGLFFYQMKIATPKYNLAVGSGSHGMQLARMLARLEPILCAQQPNWVIVFGDTNSTLAGALLAARLKLPLVHIEAGCRSGNIGQAEEQNRILTDHLSRLLLVASNNCVETLHREGIGLEDDPWNRRIAKVGDILLDALLQHSQFSEQDADIHLREFGLQSKDYYLLTLHNAENTDDAARLRGILDGVSGLKIPVLFPVHPRTKRILDELGISLNGNIRTVEPQGYLEMITFEKHARKILTDSGGVQKEAFYLGVPCITLRERTEWVETVEIGANRLVAPTPEEIQTAVCEDRAADWKGFTPYGDGTAAQKIVAELLAAGG
jgi:UDP-N-acetylglucosamine 2-epimerase